MSTQLDQPGYSGQPPQGYDARPTSVAAIIGLIGAFVFWPVGLIASIIGVSHTKPGRKKGRGLAIAGLIISVLAAIGTAVVIALLTAVATDPGVQDSVQQLNELSDGVEATSGDATGDVVINSCEAGDFGALNADATVTNTTDVPATYSITVSANDASGNRVAELNGFANSIAPGQSASVDLVGMVEDAPEGMQCVVANVTRLAS